MLCLEGRAARRVQIDGCDRWRAHLGVEWCNFVGDGQCKVSLAVQLFQRLEYSCHLIRRHKYRAPFTFLFSPPA